MNQASNIKSILDRYTNSKLTEKAELKIVTYNDHQHRPCARIWKGRQANPLWVHYFQSEERRSEFIKDRVDLSQERIDYKKKQQEDRKAFVPQVKVGDIFYSSWGYEQTNVSFYQVIEKPSKHYVLVREILQEQVGGTSQTHGMACDVVAIKDSFLDRSEPSRYKVSKSGNSESIRISSCETAHIWDGKPTYKSWYY